MKAGFLMLFGRLQRRAAGAVSEGEGRQSSSSNSPDSGSKLS